MLRPNGHLTCGLLLDSSPYHVAVLSSSCYLTEATLRPGGRLGGRCLQGRVVVVTDAVVSEDLGGDPDPAGTVDARADHDPVDDLGVDAVLRRYFEDIPDARIARDVLPEGRRELDASVADRTGHGAGPVPTHAVGVANAQCRDAREQHEAGQDGVERQDAVSVVPDDEGECRQDEQRPPGLQEHAVAVQVAGDGLDSLHGGLRFGSVGSEVGVGCGLDGLRVADVVVVADQVGVEDAACHGEPSVGVVEVADVQPVADHGVRELLLLVAQLIQAHVADVVTGGVAAALDVSEHDKTVDGTLGKDRQVAHEGAGCDQEDSEAHQHGSGQAVLGVGDEHPHEREHADEQEARPVVVERVDRPGPVGQSETGHGSLLW
jgi:hypothetical protein